MSEEMTDLARSLRSVRAEALEAWTGRWVPAARFRECRPTGMTNLARSLHSRSC